MKAQMKEIQNANVPSVLKKRKTMGKGKITMKEKNQKIKSRPEEGTCLSQSGGAHKNDASQNSQ